MKHELKTWPGYFKAVASGEKKFEFRKNDRNFKVGDILSLKEWCPETKEYTGYTFPVTVSYILTGFGLPEGTCIMSIE